MRVTASERCGLTTRVRRERVVGIAVSCLTSVRVSVFKRCVECVVGSQVTRGMCGVVRRGCPLCLSHDVGMSHTKKRGKSVCYVGGTVYSPLRPYNEYV